MSKGQIFLIGAIAAMGFMIVFTVVALEYIKVDVVSSRSQTLLRNGFSALKAAINSNAIDALITNNDASTLQFIFDNSLPSYVCYNFTVYNSTFTRSVCNVRSFEAEVTLFYVYTSVSLRNTYILVLKLAVKT